MSEMLDLAHVGERNALRTNFGQNVTNGTVHYSTKLRHHFAGTWSP